MFHNISPTTKGRGTITPAAFAADIRQLVRDGFQPVTAAQLAAFLRGKGEVPPNAVAVTFDDGYAGTYTYAFPVLRQYRARDGFLGRWAGDSFFRRHGFAVSGQESRKGFRETAGVLNERPRARRLRRTRGLFNSAW